MAEVAGGQIKCEVCGWTGHVLLPHLKAEHGMTGKQYELEYPGKPLLSEKAKAMLAEKERLAENRRVDFDVEKTFGILINEQVKTVKGWEKPHPTTPMVDPNYVFNKQSLALVLITLEDAGEQCLFVGPTGSGKTSCIMQVCARLNLPVTRINGDGDMTRMDLIGKDVLEGGVAGGTKFQYGLIPRAIREGHVLILDEHDFFDPSVKQALQGVMEEGGSLVVTETGETIQKHPDFRLFATGNSHGQGDETGLYAGVQPQNYANTMRFTLFGIVDYPMPDVEKKILTEKTGITDSHVLNKMVEYARELRDAYKKEEVQAVMSTRSLVNIGRKLVKFANVRFAYEIGFINAQNSSDREFCSELLQRVWGL